MRLACRVAALAVISSSLPAWCWAQFPAGAGASPAVAASGIAWQTDLQSAQRAAGAANKLVLVHFWAPWCKPCMKLEEQVFSRPEVAQTLNASFVCLKVNADQAPELAKAYNVTSLPTDVVLTSQGKLITQLRCPQEVNQYVQQVGQVAEGYRKFTGQVATQTAQGANYVQNYIRGTEAQVQNALAGVPPQVAAPQVPVNAQTNPATVAEPATASPPAANLAGAPASSQGAALPTYSDDRYADYFRNRQPDAAAPTATAPGATAPPAMPAATIPAEPVGQTGPSLGDRYAAQQPPQTGIPPQTAIPPQVPAGAVAAPATAASAVQLPSGSPPLGLDGYCPVLLKEQKRWVAGDRRWGAIHRGRTYLFTGPDEQKKFLESPDTYAPVISGNDPVLAMDGGQAVSGRREHGVFYENRIYLFADEASLQRFYQNPNRYAAEVVQAMR
jgi:protein disulfide-isomerase